MSAQNIELPQTVEHLQFLALQLREELIETRAAREHEVTEIKVDHKSTYILILILRFNFRMNLQLSASNLLKWNLTIERRRTCCSLKDWSTMVRIYLSIIQTPLILGIHPPVAMNMTMNYTRIIMFKS